MTIKAGGLRQKVKNGQVDPKEVLAWLLKQEEPRSERFVSFLKNQIKKGNKTKRKKKKS